MTSTGRVLDGTLLGPLPWALTPADGLADPAHAFFGDAPSASAVPRWNAASMAACLWHQQEVSIRRLGVRSP